jgi:hypothetical protein
VGENRRNRSKFYASTTLCTTNSTRTRTPVSGLRGLTTDCLNRVTAHPKEVYLHTYSSGNLLHKGSLTKAHSYVQVHLLLVRMYEAESDTKVNLLLLLEQSVTNANCVIYQHNHPLFHNAYCVAVYKPSDPICDKIF